MLAIYNRTWKYACHQIRDNLRTLSGYHKFNEPSTDMGLSFGKSAEYFLEVPFWHVFFFTHFFTQFPSVRNGDKFHLIPTNQLWIVYTLLHPPTNPLPPIPNGVKSHTNSTIPMCLPNVYISFSTENTPFQNQQSFLFLIYENTKMGIII